MIHNESTLYDQTKKKPEYEREGGMKRGRGREEKKRNKKKTYEVSGLYAYATVAATKAPTIPI